MLLTPARAQEVAKYEQANRQADYRLGDRRRAHIADHLKRGIRGSLLDVSTGRGETLQMARDLGYTPVRGTETVDYLCDGDIVVQALGHDLPFPDKSFDTVTMFDVMEHLLPEDTCLVCEELARVARRRILLTVHNGPSRGLHGVELHINRRASYGAWHAELVDHFQRDVIRHGMARSISEMFEVVL